MNYYNDYSLLNACSKRQNVIVKDQIPQADLEELGYKYDNPFDTFQGNSIDNSYNSGLFRDNSGKDIN